MGWRGGDGAVCGRGGYGAYELLHCRALSEKVALVLGLGRPVSDVFRPWAAQSGSPVLELYISHVNDAVSRVIALIVYNITYNAIWRNAGPMGVYDMADTSRDMAPVATAVIQ